jgi:uncharacterized protein (DUF58 family)
MAALCALYDLPRYETGPSPDGDLVAALTSLERTQVRRGRVVVVSDFLASGDWEKPISRLALRHEVIAICVTDPREFALPAVGVLSVVDPESGAQLHVQTNSVLLRDRYAKAAVVRHGDIKQKLKLTGAHYLHLSTDRDVIADIARFVGRRRVERVKRQSPDQVRTLSPLVRP